MDGMSREVPSTQQWTGCSWSPVPSIGSHFHGRKTWKTFNFGVRIIKIAREAEGQNDGPREEGSVALFILEKKKIKGGSYK